MARPKIGPVTRYVRTPEGADFYGLPVGSPIKPDLIKSKNRAAASLGIVPPKGAIQDESGAVDRSAESARPAVKIGEAKSTGPNTFKIGKAQYGVPAGSRIFQSKGKPGLRYVMEPDGTIRAFNEQGEAEVPETLAETLAERFENFEESDDRYEELEFESSSAPEGAPSSTPAAADPAAPASPATPATPSAPAPEPRATEPSAPGSSEADPATPDVPENVEDMEGYLSNEEIEKRLRAAATDLGSSALDRLEDRLLKSNEMIRARWERMRAAAAASEFDEEITAIVTPGRWAAGSVSIRPGTSITDLTRADVTGAFFTTDRRWALVKNDMEVNNKRGGYSIYHAPTGLIVRPVKTKQEATQYATAFSTLGPLSIDAPGADHTQKEHKPDLIRIKDAIMGVATGRFTPPRDAEETPPVEAPAPQGGDVATPEFVRSAPEGAKITHYPTRYGMESATWTKGADGSWTNQYGARLREVDIVAALDETVLIDAPIVEAESSLYPGAPEFAVDDLQSAYDSLSAHTGFQVAYGLPQDSPLRDKETLGALTTHARAQYPALSPKQAVLAHMRDVLKIAPEAPTPDGPEAGPTISVGAAEPKKTGVQGMNGGSFSRADIQSAVDILEGFQGKAFKSELNKRGNALGVLDPSSIVGIEKDKTIAKQKFIDYLKGILDANPEQAPEAEEEPAGGSEENESYAARAFRTGDLAELEDQILQEFRAGNGLPQDFSIQIAESSVNITGRALGIVGPELRVKGRIFFRGEDVGYFDRSYGKGLNGPAVLHREIAIAEQVRGRGFGQAFDEMSTELYRDLGFSEILTTAMTDGAYVWARAGYDWNENAGISLASKEMMASHLRAKMMKIKYPTTPLDGASPNLTPELQARIEGIIDVLDAGGTPDMAAIASMTDPNVPNLGRFLLTGSTWPARKRLSEPTTAPETDTPPAPSSVRTPQEMVGQSPETAAELDSLPNGTRINFLGVSHIRQADGLWYPAEGPITGPDGRPSAFFSDALRGITVYDVRYEADEPITDPNAEAAQSVVGDKIVVRILNTTAVYTRGEDHADGDQIWRDDTTGRYVGTGELAEAFANDADIATDPSDVSWSARRLRDRPAPAENPVVEESEYERQQRINREALAADQQAEPTGPWQYANDAGRFFAIRPVRNHPLGVSFIYDRYPDGGLRYFRNREMAMTAINALNAPEPEPAEEDPIPEIIDFPVGSQITSADLPNLAVGSRIGYIRKKDGRITYYNKIDPFTYATDRGTEVEIDGWKNASFTVYESEIQSAGAPTPDPTPEPEETPDSTPEPEETPAPEAPAPESERPVFEVLYGDRENAEDAVPGTVEAMPEYWSARRELETILYGTPLYGTPAMREQPISYFVSQLVVRGFAEKADAVRELDARFERFRLNPAGVVLPPQPVNLDAMPIGGVIQVTLNVDGTSDTLGYDGPGWKARQTRFVTRRAWGWESSDAQGFVKEYPGRSGTLTTMSYSDEEVRWMQANGVVTTDFDPGEIDTRRILEESLIEASRDDSIRNRMVEIELVDGSRELIVNVANGTWLRPNGNSFPHGSVLGVAKQGKVRTPLDDAEWTEPPAALSSLEQLTELRDGSIIVDNYQGFTYIKVDGNWARRSGYGELQGAQSDRKIWHAAGRYTRPGGWQVRFSAPDPDVPQVFEPGQEIPIEAVGSLPPGSIAVASTGQFVVFNADGTYLELTPTGDSYNSTGAIGTYGRHTNVRTVTLFRVGTDPVPNQVPPAVGEEFEPRDVARMLSMPLGTRFSGREYSRFGSIRNTKASETTYVVASEGILVDERSGAPVTFTQFSNMPDTLMDGQTIERPRVIEFAEEPNAYNTVERLRSAPIGAIFSARQGGLPVVKMKENGYAVGGYFKTMSENEIVIRFGGIDLDPSASLRVSGERPLRDQADLDNLAPDTIVYDPADVTRSWMRNADGTWASTEQSDPPQYAEGLIVVPKSAFPKNRNQPALPYQAFTSRPGTRMRVTEAGGKAVSYDYIKGSWTAITGGRHAAKKSPAAMFAYAASGQARILNTPVDATVPLAGVDFSNDEQFWSAFSALEDESTIEAFAQRRLPNQKWVEFRLPASMKGADRVGSIALYREYMGAAIQFFEHYPELQGMASAGGNREVKSNAWAYVGYKYEDPSRKYGARFETAELRFNINSTLRSFIDANGSQGNFHVQGQREDISVPLRTVIHESGHVFDTMTSMRLGDRAVTALDDYVRPFPADQQALIRSQFGTYASTNRKELVAVSFELWHSFDEVDPAVSYVMDAIQDEFRTLTNKPDFSFRKFPGSSFSKDGTQSMPTARPIDEIIQSMAPSRVGQPVAGYQGAYAVGTIAQMEGRLYEKGHGQWFEIDSDTGSRIADPSTETGFRERSMYAQMVEVPGSRILRDGFGYSENDPQSFVYPDPKRYAALPRQEVLRTTAAGSSIMVDGVRYVKRADGFWYSENGVRVNTASLFSKVLRSKIPSEGSAHAPTAPTTIEIDRLIFDDYEFPSLAEVLAAYQNAG